MALFLVFGGWCMQASAGWVPGQLPTTKPSELVDGGYYYFRSACNATALNGVMANDKSYQVGVDITEKHIFKVVFGDKNPFTGAQMIYLQSVETGKWFGGSDNAWTIESIEEATAITPCRASETTAPDFITWPDGLTKEDLPTVREWIDGGGDQTLPDTEIFEVNTSFNKCPGWKWRAAELDKEGGDALTLGIYADNYDGTQSTITWFKQVWGSSSYPVSFATGRTGINAWYAYSAEYQVDPIGDLEKLLSEYKTDNHAVFFRKGTDPGCVADASVYDAFEAKFKEAVAYAEGGDLPTDEQSQKYLDELKELRARLDTTARVPLTEGYYFLVNGYEEFEKQQKFDVDVNGDGSEIVQVSKLKAIYDSETNPPAWNDFLTLKTAEDGKQSVQKKVTRAYIFHITKSETDEGMWNIRNALTGRYFDGVDADRFMKKSAYHPNIAQQVQVCSESPSTFFIAIKGATTYQWYHAFEHKNGAGTGDRLKGWTKTYNTASQWRFMAVDDQLLLDSITSELAQKTLENGLKAEIEKAQTTMDKGHVPFITSADQLSGNANETKEGSLANLIDGKTDTYYHSMWYATGPDEDHYLQVNVDEPMDKLAVKWYKRTQNSANRPTKITVMGSTDGENWAQAGVLPAAGDTLPWGSKTPEYTGVVNITGGPYKAFRFVVNETTMADGTKRNAETPDTIKDGMNNKHPFFTFSEFSVYNGMDEYGYLVYRSGSLAYRDDMKAPYKALKDAVKTAQGKLGQVTQSDIDAMKAANEAFALAFPDTTILDGVLAKAKTFYEEALSSGGDESLLGAYNTESVYEALGAAISTAEAGYNKQDVTRAYIDEQTALLQQAIDNFVADINMPEMDTWYMMVNVYQGEDRNENTNPYNKLMYAGGKSIGDGVKWGGDPDTEGYEDPTCVWRFVSMGEGTFAVQNLGTGYYLGANRGTSAQYLLSDTAVAFKFAYVAGEQLTLEDASYNADENSYRYLHAAADNKVVTWSASKNSPSAWTFRKVDCDAFQALRRLPVSGMDIFCFPYVTAANGNVTDFFGTPVNIYTLASSNADAEGKITEITLNPLEVPVGGIPAGTPYIVVSPEAEDEDGKAIVDFDIDMNAPLSTTAGTVNGLVGLLTGQTVAGAGCGYFEGSTQEITVAGKDTGISSQSGYINPRLITEQIEAAEGHLVIRVTGDGVLDNIQEAIKDANALVNVVDMSGVVIRTNVKQADALKGLSKGVYIVNGKKVAVK